MKNYYSILEVSENASPEVIDKAYRVLVKRYHPDLQANDSIAEARIREINEAYNVLSDNFLREQYDAELQKELGTDNNFQESDYGRLYKEKQKLKYQLEHEKYDKERITRLKEEAEEEVKKEKNTSSSGMIAIIRGLFKYRPKLSDLKKIKKLDFVALGLTVVIILAIGLILYFLPFTHDWMRSEILLMK